MENNAVLISLSVPLTLICLAVYYLVISKNFKREGEILDKKNNGYLGCLISSSNLLKMILRNVSDQIAKIDYVRSVFKEGYTNNNISFESHEYVRELMNITKNSEALVDKGSNLQKLNENNEQKNSFFAMVIVPYVTVLLVTALTNVFFYATSPSSLEVVYLFFLILILVISYVLLFVSYKKYAESYAKYLDKLSYVSSVEKNIDLQSNNLKIFKNVIADYLYMFGLFVPEKDNKLNYEVKNNIEAIEKYSQQITEVSEILNSDYHSTDLNEVLQKVLLTRVKNTDELGIKISATSEHPLFVDIDESSLYFVLLTLIDDVMKKSAKGALIDFKAKRQNNIASISILADVVKISQEENKTVKEKPNHLNTEIILPSKEGIDMYMIKTILDRFGGEFSLESDTKKVEINLSLQLEVRPSSAY
jgi:uncharacterized membrane protein